MSPVRGPGPRSPGIVVGIGDHGLESSRTAVRLGAEEAALRRVTLGLVHGSRPAAQRDAASSSDMAARQQQGRRLVNGAARELAGTPLGRELQIWTESSPQTGVELLLAHGRTAVMLVLQRGEGLSVPAGSTTGAVTADAGCTTLVTRSGVRPVGTIGVLVVLDPDLDPAPAIALAFGEAALRDLAVSVLDGCADGVAAQHGVRRGRAEHPHVEVRHVEVEPGRAVTRLREVSGRAALLVAVRPAPGRVAGTLAAAVDDALGPVLLVVPAVTAR